MELVTTQLDAVRIICVCCCTEADIVIKKLLPDFGNLTYSVAEIGTFNDNFDKDGFPSRWETGTDASSYNVKLFETEIRNNLFGFDAKGKLDYKRLIDYELGEFLPKWSIYLGWLYDYTDKGGGFDYINFLVQYRKKDYQSLALRRFADNLNCITNLLQSISHTIDNYYRIVDLNTQNGQEIIDKQLQPTEPGAKLQWNCKPAVAGYIISELIRAGYIEPPITNGELSYAKLAGICNQIFDIRSNGKPTTLDYLKKVVNPESNTLSDSTRAKLKLPDLDQLS